MQRFNLAVFIPAIAIFALACNNGGNTNQTANVNTASTPPATTTATPSSPPTTTTSGEFAAARSTYNAACIRCHKDNGEGGVVELDKGMSLKVPSFKTGHGLTHTDDQFERQIANGGDGMPAFKDRLTPEQIDELVRFIRHEFQAGLIKAPASSEAPAQH